MGSHGKNTFFTIALNVWLSKLLCYDAWTGVILDECKALNKCFFLMKIASIKYLLSMQTSLYHYWEVFCYFVHTFRGNRTTKTSWTTIKWITTVFITSLKELNNGYDGYC